MKNIYTYAALFIIVLLTSCSSTKSYEQSYPPESSDITYQQFYDDLSPYGDWVDYPNYGYVWIPAVQQFRPYYNNGHWIYTDYGWTWVSNYSWGWAPFHYGRWTHDDGFGWMWIPGYEWAPAWVSWRSNSDYYGWAPLGPGMDINSNFGSNIPYDYWSFVPNRYINSPRINNYYVNREKNVTIINNTTIINNPRTFENRRVYITGPTPAEVEKNTHERIRPIKIVQRNTPGGSEITGGSVKLYRPAVKETQPQTQHFKPQRIGNLNEIRERRVTTPTTEVNRNPQSPANTNPLREPNPQKRNNNNLPEPRKLNPVREEQAPQAQPEKKMPVENPEGSQEDNPRQKIQSPSRTFPEQKNNQPPGNVTPPRARVTNQPNTNENPRPVNKYPAPVKRIPANPQQNNIHQAPKSQPVRPPVNRNEQLKNQPPVQSQQPVRHFQEQPKENK